jgi:hypothetical protein
VGARVESRLHEDRDHPHGGHELDHIRDREGPQDDPGRGSKWIPSALFSSYRVM